jgi:hypothetical protein
LQLERRKIIMNTRSSGNHKWTVFGIILSVYFFLGLLYAIPVEALRLKTNWAQRVDLSEKVFRGQVVQVKSYWNPEKTRIYTDVTVSIDEHIKGDGLSEITITIPGGTVGDDTQWVSDTPQFEGGDYAVILLESSARVTGGPDGVYSLQKQMVGANQLQSMEEDKFLSWIRTYVNGQNRASFEEVPEQTSKTSGMPLQESTSFATISGVNPSTISAGTNSVLTVNGSGFGASRGSGSFPTIAFRYEDSDYMYSNSKFVSWSDTQIQLYVWTGIVNSYDHSPGCWSDTVGFVNSGGSIESTYALTIPFGYGRAKWATSSVTYYVNPTGGPSGTEAAIQAAANTWSGAGANFSFNYAGTTGNGFECNNTIGFGNVGDSTIIGQAITCFSSGAVTGAGIQFNTQFNWSTAAPTPNGYMDLQSIALHEMGHWLRLLDLYGDYDTTKVMYGFSSYGQMKRSLASGDQQGIQWIYPPSGWTAIPGATPSSPAVAWNPVANKLQIVVRRSDNSLWAGTFNSSGVFNNDWTSIPGNTPSAPALAWNPVANNLQIVVRSSNDSIWAGTFNSSGVFNNDWTSIPGNTPSAPALAWNPVANELQIVVRASNDSLWVATFNSDGVFNNDWTSILGNTPSAPVLAWNPVANNLQIVVRSSNDSIWAGTFNSSGVFNNDWVNISGNTPSSPALAWDSSTSEIAIVVRASNDTIWLATFDSGGNFNNDWNNISGFTPTSLGMAYLPSIGYLVIVIRASDDSLWRRLY